MQIWSTRRCHLALSVLLNWGNPMSPGSFPEGLRDDFNDYRSNQNEDVSEWTPQWDWYFHPFLGSGILLQLVDPWWYSADSCGGILPIMSGGSPACIVSESAQKVLQWKPINQLAGIDMFWFEKSLSSSWTTMTICYWWSMNNDSSHSQLRLYNDHSP